MSSNEPRFVTIPSQPNTIWMATPVGSVATAAGIGPEPSRCSDRRRGNTTPGLPGTGRTREHFGALRPDDDANSGGTPGRRQPSGSRQPGTLRLVMSPEPKLHERDRLKHVGEFGEEQTARVVRNGEGGPKRVWKPAARNQVHRGTGARTFPPGNNRDVGNAPRSSEVQVSAQTRGEGGASASRFTGIGSRSGPGRPRSCSVTGSG